MNDIEQLLRDSLHAAPTPQPSISDPVVTIERRARRARVFLAGGALAVAAVVTAAIVVPLQLVDRSDGDGQVGVPSATQPPSPRPSASTEVQPDLIWQGANWVAAGPNGLPWMVYVDGSGPNGGTRLAQLVASGMPRYRVRLQTPADRPLPGRSVVWVLGSLDDANGLSRVSAVTTSGRLVTSKAYDGRVLSYATVVGDDLYAVDRGSSGGTRITRFRLVNGQIIAASVAFPEAETIWSTKSGHVWVQSAKELTEIRDDGSGPALGPVVSWLGAVVGTVTDGSADQALWVWDGSRLVELTPTLLAQGVSVAEGRRLPLPQRPGFVVSSSNGGVYVAIQDDPMRGLYYYPAAQFEANDPTPSASLPMDVQPNVICPDPRGGIDVLDNDGILQRWNPPT